MRQRITIEKWHGGASEEHDLVATAGQAETDRYWNAIVGNGGQESACGWCKDKWGLSWQITPINPIEAAVKRAFDAMMQMTKIDIAAIDAALRG
jgi:predicted 3-demethylubiquinone-9 3-methyltransferase (glyoxalase superfamily)